MYQIQLKFMGQNKKITISKGLPSAELNKLIGQCFTLNQRVVGVTDPAGKFYELNKLTQDLSNSKDTFSLVTVKDLRQESMSFATEFYHRRSDNKYEEAEAEPTLDIPPFAATHCLGIITDIDLFEELILPEEKVTVVACFTKVKPAELAFQYYLFQNESKNSIVVYHGTAKVCQFYIADWADPNPQVGNFIQGLTGEVASMKKKSGYDKYSL